MADISMCPDDSCPHKVRCKRHQSSGTRAGHRQSWAMFPRHGDNPIDCDGWWPISEIPKKQPVYQLL